MPTNTLRLGKLIKDYERSSASVAKGIVVSLICAGIAALFFTGAIVDTQNGLAAKIGVSVIGPLFLLPPFFGIYMLIRGRGASLSLYENGLIYRRGGKEFMTAWD